METKAVYGFKNGARVQTPLGVGSICARVQEENDWDPDYLVVFSRGEYPAAQWLSISLGNGPCVFKVFGPAEISHAAG